MSSADDGRIRAHRDLIRGGLIALGVPIVVIGAWALLAPHGWYSNFPGGNRHWVSKLGPYDEHLVRDFGSVYLGLGLLLVASGVLLGRQLVVAALGTLLVFSVPHFIFHLTKLDAFPTADNVANMVTLALTVLGPVGLLVLIARPAPAVASASDESTIEGGIRYGTR